MAKYKTAAVKESSGVITVTTPSPFGSHASMVVRELEDGKVVCKDDVHEYETHKNRLDTGLADANRYGK
jgi:hypothetical protein